MGQVISLQSLKEKLIDIKTQGKKIVFTNGCFDILHIGHVRYLKEAKKFGDILIVGLNSDLSVASLKPFRPIIPEAERAEIIASLEMIDYVVIFNEETPYELIKEVKPDVLVKGGDWKKEDIVGSDLVSKVFSLSYVDGISTTDIIKRILERFSKETT
ncbi:MAG: D-glycero-beta-D-manno-heptose 1-phosphate adenylyltransferase [Thermodesulfovibrionales bacterium]|nr:D-glycero-beta-D-manno-heptose 1-phosphate adenylyltransferase [Thermodesulfovibrionales bacterium]